jgi:hypothetical protein
VSPGSSPSETATAAVSATPSASASPTLAWQQIGSTTGGRIVGFAAGYVALGGSSQLEFSPDGRTWTAERVPFHASKDVHGIALEATVEGIASNGRQVVVVGGYGHVPCQPDSGAGGGPQCPSSPISWVTTDGVNWTSSYPWRGPGAPKPYRQGNTFSTVWAVPSGGWDAASLDIAGEAGAAERIYHSTDGLSWTALASPPNAFKGAPEPTEIWNLGLADSTGRRLVGGYWYLPNGDSVARLFSSVDTKTWTTAHTFPINERVDLGLAPDPALGPLWIIAGEDSTSVPTVWTSADLVTWSAHHLPTAAAGARGSVTGLAVTKLGYLAVGQLADGPDGSPYHASWISTTGTDWVRLATPGSPGDDGPDNVADGPAGVLGFANYNGSEDPPGVWLLK